MRRFFLTTLILGSIGYTCGWYYLADKLQKNIEFQVTQLKSQGYEVEYKNIKVEGFPFSISVAVEEPTFTQNNLFKAWIEGPLHFKTVVWRPQRVKASAQSISHFNLQLNNSEKISFISQGFTLIFSKFFDFSNFELTFDRLALMNEAFPLIEGQILSLKAIQPQPETETLPPTKRFDFIIDIQDISGTLLENNPLGAVIKEIKCYTAFRGPTEGNTITEKLQTWYQADGTFDISRLSINWGTLQLNAEGTFSLDEQLQPLAAFSTEIRGLDNTLDTLVEGQIIKKKNAHLAKMALHFLAEAPQDPTLPGTHRASISIQDSKVDLGPVTLFKIPKFKWK